MPSLERNVFIVTGRTAGVGLELAKILYSKNGPVYIACRSTTKGAKVVEIINSACPASTGTLVIMPKAARRGQACRG